MDAQGRVGVAGVYLQSARGFGGLLELPFLCLVRQADLPVVERTKGKRIGQKGSYQQRLLWVKEWGRTSVGDEHEVRSSASVGWYRLALREFEKATHTLHPCKLRWRFASSPSVRDCENIQEWICESVARLSCALTDQYLLFLPVPRRGRLGLVAYIDCRDQEKAAKVVGLGNATLLDSIEDLDSAVLINSLCALGTSLATGTCAEEDDVGRILGEQRGNVRDRRLLERSDHRLD